MNNEQISPLVFLHPDGFIHNSLVIGENAPAHLFLPGVKIKDDVPVDLIVWAPSVEECRKHGELRSDSENIRSALAADGLVYGLIPVRWRIQAQRLLRTKGFEIEMEFVHLPDWFRSRNLIPIDPGPAKYAFTQQIPTRTLVRSIGLAALQSSSGRRLIGLFHPSAAFVARPRGSRPLFLWLYRQANIQPKKGHVSLAATWKGDLCSVVLHGFECGPDPKAVAKTIVTENGLYEEGNEFCILTQLGPAARQAGAEVPQPLKIKDLGNYQIFLQSFIPGKCAAVVLAGHPKQLEPIIKLVTTWLTAWNKVTAMVRPLDTSSLAQIFLAPLEIIASRLANYTNYRSWLIDLCTEIAGPVKLVTAHNDLTLWNILLYPNESIGVVDWHASSPAALPLSDFFYIFVDAVAVAHRFDHERAFLECMEAHGQYRSLFQDTLSQMQAALSLRSALVTLSLHACFIHHAANEQQEQLLDEDHPFLHILLWLEKKRWVLGQEEK